MFTNLLKSNKWAIKLDGGYFCHYLVISGAVSLLRVGVKVASTRLEEGERVRYFVHNSLVRFLQLICKTHTILHLAEPGRLEQKVTHACNDNALSGMAPLVTYKWIKTSSAHSKLMCGMNIQSKVFIVAVLMHLVLFKN